MVKMDAVNQLEIALPAQLVKPVLTALLHTIFFHRTMDTIEPETYEVLECHVACVPSPEIRQLVEKKADDFASRFIDTGAEQGEIAVVFQQKRPRKGWLFATEELIPWEAHFISIHFPRHQTPPFGSQDLNNCLVQIMSFCLAQRHDVPPLGGGEASGLSHQILINPPAPSTLFTPSPPLPARSPPPVTGTTTALALARDVALPPSSAADEVREVRRGSSPAALFAAGGAAAYAASNRDGARDSRDGARAGTAETAMGYLESAKGGLRAVGAKAGAVAGWAGRGRN